MKTTKLIQTLAATAIFLTATSAWAMEQDTGYPWYRDIPKENHQVTSNSSNVVLAPVLPSEEDTGYPWFADIRDDDKSTMKPLTIFKSHPRSADQDSGYPWHADTKEGNPALMEPETKIQ
jgi:hypothetical protein